MADLKAIFAIYFIPTLTIFRGGGGSGSGGDGGVCVNHRSLNNSLCEDMTVDFLAL